MNEKMLKCYRILGLPPGTLMADVHQRCRELKKICDPDNFHEPGKKREAHERRREIDNASNWLLEFSLHGTSRLHPEVPEKQLELGNQYLAWAIGPEDYQEAIEQYRKSAEQGYLHAQFMLFEIYGDGLLLDFSGSLWRPPSIAQDKAEAYKWLLLAALNDYKSAKLNVDSYPSFLTSEEIAEGKRRAAQFMAARPWFRKSGVQKSWERFKGWLTTGDRP